MNEFSPVLAALAARTLESLRVGHPLVQCLTNHVVSNFTANVLLALDASPAMVDIPGEAGPFAEVASGVLVNLGTIAPYQQDAMREAARAADQAGTPWVLDPVAVGALPVRSALAAELLEHGPAIIRGNPSEIIALASLAGVDTGHQGSAPRGVDSLEGTDQARGAALALASRTGAVVAVSGEVDLVTDGRRTVHCHNGTPLLTRVTGGGCSLGAVMAAALGGSPESAFEAAVGATALYTVAAERAAETLERHQSGTFLESFLDTLGSLTPEDVAREARLTEEGDGR